MQTNLKYLNERQDVLSQNIANANVSGYMAKDLKAPDFKGALDQASASANTSSVRLATTAEGHISGNGSSGNFATVTKSRREGEITPNGNNVVLEDEVLKMSKNNLEYQQTADLYRKMLDMIKTAIGNV